MIKISLYYKEIIIYNNSLNADLIYISYIYILRILLEFFHNSFSIIFLESLFLLGNFDMIFW